MSADLHIHTNFSDGILSPEDIIRKARDAGLACIAITDHDTVDGIPSAIIEGRKLGVKVVPGIEFTTDVPGTEIHILGYFLDYKAGWLLELLKKIRFDRVNRIYKMVEKLKKLGVDIEADEILKLVDLGSVGRPHVARVLVQKGKVGSIQEAFNRYLDFNAPAYVPHFKLTPAEAVKTIIKAGGVPVYAHPGISADDGIIPELVKAGLAGIEVYYSKHSDFQVNHYLTIAEKYGLVVTGGSDFHGSLMRDFSLGQVTVPDELVEKLEARVKK
jgi:hypothetical protein